MKNGMPDGQEIDGFGKEWKDAGINTANDGNRIAFHDLRDNAFERASGFSPKCVWMVSCR